MTEIKRARVEGGGVTRYAGLFRCECWDCQAFRRQLLRRVLRLALGAAALALLARHAVPPKVLTALWPFGASAPWM